MKKDLNIGIGFVTGRSNVCSVINSYYSYIKGQLTNLDRKVNITFYILFVLSTEPSSIIITSILSKLWSRILLRVG